MSFKNSYLDSLMKRVIERNRGESEFHQAVREVLESIEPVVIKRPELIERGILEKIVEPESVIIFRVPWTDDEG